MKKLNSKGFTAIAGLLLVVIIGGIGGTGYFVYNAQQKTKESLSAATKSQVTPQKSKKQTSNSATAPVDKNSYLVIKEWGLRFEIPSGLTDVKYLVQGDTAAFYGKPAGSIVQYRTDYDKFVDGRPQHATGELYRSTDSSKEAVGEFRQGKKLGSYYYYTAWSFNSLASGAGCRGLYGVSDSDCQQEGVAFQLINQGDGALINTIELAP